VIALDETKALQEKDPGGMLAQVASLPQQLSRAAAVRAAVRKEYPDLQRQLGAVDSVLICGMGGSAIGGEFAAAWASAFDVAVRVHRGYGLPAGVRPKTLVVFSSYSGHTEETLSAFDASKSSQPCVCITTGGALAARARKSAVPVIEVPAGLQPRAALGHSLVAQMVVLQSAALVDVDCVKELERAARFLESIGENLDAAAVESRNPAKQLARLSHGVLPVFLTGNGATQPIGTRWKGQWNENAKQLALSSVLPEMNHNEIMAFTALPELRRNVRLFFLRDREDAPEVQRRMRVTADLLSAEVASVEWLETQGDTRLQRLLAASWLGDWASVFLAFLNEVDPTTVGAIEQLKRRLAQPE
jgi:glucose/mannose-6-phosphate isomerase